MAENTSGSDTAEEYHLVVKQAISASIPFLATCATRLNRGQSLAKLLTPPADYVADTKVVKSDTTDGFRFTLADTTWLLIRFSGAEPVLRIYTESNTQARVEKLIELGKELAGV